MSGNGPLMLPTFTRDKVIATDSFALSLEASKWSLLDPLCHLMSGNGPMMLSTFTRGKVIATCSFALSLDVSKWPLVDPLCH